MPLKLTKRYQLHPDKMNFAMKMNHVRLSSSYLNYLHLRCIFQNLSDRFDNVLVFHVKKLSAKLFFKMNFLVLWHLYVFVDIIYFCCLFSFLLKSLSEAVLQCQLYYNIKFILCRCISFMHSKQNNMNMSNMSNLFMDF